MPESGSRMWRVFPNEAGESALALFAQVQAAEQASVDGAEA